MKLVIRALYAWNWNLLLRQRRAITRLGALSDRRTVALSRRMDCRCAALLRLERRLSDAA